jgi:hypothetical protein
MKIEPGGAPGGSTMMILPKECSMFSMNEHSRSGVEGAMMNVLFDLRNSKSGGVEVFEKETVRKPDIQD